MSRETKSVDELLKELRDLDYGFCNPYKAQFAAEDENDIKAELRRRNLSNEQIEKLKYDSQRYSTNA